MGKSVFTILMGLMLSVMMMSQALALDVFVTKNGKKYHKEGSRFLKNKDVTKMTQEEAEEMGYTPSREFIKWQQSEETPQNK